MEPTYCVAHSGFCPGAEVVQNEYDAEYHGGGEGVVTLVTKNGGQKFHAEVYDYLRSSALDANTWSNKNVAPPDPITQRPNFYRNQLAPT